MNLLRLWEFHHYYSEGDMAIYNNQCLQYKNGDWINVAMPAVHDTNYKSWNPDKKYIKDQLVVFNGVLWNCTEEHICDVNPDICEFFEIKKLNNEM